MTDIETIAFDAYELGEHLYKHHEMNYLTAHRIAGASVTFFGNQISTLAARLAEAEKERDRFEHIANRTQRSRRYTSEQWAQAGREAMAGKPQNLRNRIELHELPAPRREDQSDGSALLILDGEKIETIEAELTAALAERDALADLLRPFANASIKFDMHGSEWLDHETQWNEAGLKVGDLRSAHSILAEIEGHKGLTNDKA